jgi:hypothetical protein
VYPSAVVWNALPADVTAPSVLSVLHLAPATKLRICATPLAFWLSAADHRSAACAHAVRFGMLEAESTEETSTRSDWDEQSEPLGLPKAAHSESATAFVVRFSRNSEFIVGVRSTRFCAKGAQLAAEDVQTHVESEQSSVPICMPPGRRSPTE